MTITIYEASVYLALSLKYIDSKQRNFSLMVDLRTYRVLDIGVSDAQTTYDSRSSIINLLQSSPSINWNIFFASTTPPTERDLGMGQMRGLTLIAYYKDGDIFYKDRNNSDFSTHWNPPRSLTKNSLKKNLIDFARPSLGKNEVKNQETSNNFYLKYTNIRYPYGDPRIAFIRSFDTLGNDSRVYKLSYEHKPNKFSLPSNLVNVSGERVDSEFRDSIFMQLAWAIVGEGISIRNESGPIYPGHNIGSVLRGPNDEILRWGLNTKNEHGTLHGEVNLIQTYQSTIRGDEIGKSFPKQNKPILYSTLEPCYMCAAMYKESGVDLRCLYGQKDENINNNALQSSNAQAKFSSSSSGSSGVKKFGEILELISEYIPKKSLSITGYINNKKIEKLLTFALNEYINLVPLKIKIDSEKPDILPPLITALKKKRDDWVNADVDKKLPDAQVWENGLRLLNYINSGVQKKWQSRTDRHYRVTGVDP